MTNDWPAGIDRLTSFRILQTSVGGRKVEAEVVGRALHSSSLGPSGRLTAPEGLAAVRRHGIRTSYNVRLDGGAIVALRRLVSDIRVCKRNAGALMTHRYGKLVHDPSVLTDARSSAEYRLWQPTPMDHLLVCLSVCLSICLFVSPSFSLSVYMCMCVCMCACVCLCVCLGVALC
jgi:hypothetical protein